jgi:hypothetical protein
MVKKYVTFEESHYKAVNSDQGDDFPQYINTSISREISATHTFNPLDNHPPFILGPNADGYLISGLNADLLDGYHAADLLAAIGATGPVGPTGPTGSSVGTTTILHTTISFDWELASTTITSGQDVVRYDIYTTINGNDGNSYTSYCRFAISYFNSIYKFVGYSILTLQNEAIVTSDYDSINDAIKFVLDSNTGILGFYFKSNVSGAACKSVVYKGNEILELKGPTGPVGPIGPTGSIAQAYHNDLQGLTQDDPHTQYVSVSENPRTISVAHTFNPGATGPAFIMGANASTQLIVGLNADLLDGYHVSSFLFKDFIINYTTIGTGWETATTISNTSEVRQFNIYTKLINNSVENFYSSHCTFAIAEYSSGFKFVGFPLLSILQNESIIYLTTDNNNYNIRFSLNASTGDLQIQYKADINTNCKSIISII